ncbi:hypothetical protein B0H10DRAFT_284102 [Mycena sp. CBHHK59/15]|nr:hypothetical protein B0H10DRAFT_284102 [Mycena sp. CBHHK59/15]
MHSPPSLHGSTAMPPTIGSDGIAFPMHSGSHSLASMESHEDPDRRANATNAPRTPPRKNPSFSPTTPQRVSSHDSDGAYTKVSDIQHAVNHELKDAWVEEAADTLPFQAELLKEIYQHYPGLDDAVQKWLRVYSGYDSEGECWTSIPVDARLESQLYSPVVDVIKDIMEAFETEQQEAGTEKPGQILKKREVRGTYNKEIPHNIPDAAQGKKLKSRPDISTLGVGPSATKEAGILKTATYPQIASVYELKLEEALGDDEKAQVAVYAREVFATQPNRIFVYTPIMTGSTIRVIRFDRAGAKFSQLIDYHKDPVFFIKLVVLLSSLHEELLGYDTSIYWTQKDGRMQRVLEITPEEVVDDDGSGWVQNDGKETLMFDISDIPTFARRTIRSRGTICWDAVCTTPRYEGRRFIIKDYWGAAERTRESVFLKQLAGIKGVGQMFAYQNDRKFTHQIFGFALESQMLSTTDVTVPNRSLTRLVLEKYGNHLNFATSAHQLLYAVRDAVAGHANALFVHGILHRDISIGNFLLSPKEGEAGVVIDFDMAKNMQEIIAGNSTEGDSRTGTRAYQSAKVLLQSPKLGHHDHLDDLESVYYVLFTVFYGHDSQGKPLRNPPRQLVDWNDPSIKPEVLSDGKRTFINDDICSPITRYTGLDSEDQQVLEKFFDDLHAFFRSRMDDVSKALKLRGPAPFPEYTPKGAHVDYARFLAIIDLAIQSLSNAPPPIVPAPPSPSNSVRSTGSGKRGRVAEAETPRKKANISTEDQSVSVRRSGRLSNADRGKPNLKYVESPSPKRARKGKRKSL